MLGRVEVGVWGGYLGWDGVARLSSRDKIGPAIALFRGGTGILVCASGFDWVALADCDIVTQVSRKENLQ